MSHAITLQLSDHEYAALERAAAVSGEAPDEWAAARLRERLPLAPENGSEGAIPSEIQEFLLRWAASTGRSIDDVTAQWLRELSPQPRPPVSEEEGDAADERLLRHTVSLGYALGSDNEAIDADLARAYADDHASLNPKDPDRAEG
jgi:hypothetical protein